MDVAEYGEFLFAIIHFSADAPPVSWTGHPGCLYLTCP
jgi:hypothetical protein